jgi:hypothetical protein
MMVSGVVVIRLSGQGSEWADEAERRRAMAGPHEAFTWWLATDENGGPLEGPDGEVEERVFLVLRGPSGSLSDDLILLEQSVPLGPSEPFSNPQPIESFRLDGAWCHVHYRPPRPQDPTDHRMNELMELLKAGAPSDVMIEVMTRMARGRDSKSES